MGSSVSTTAKDTNPNLILVGDQRPRGKRSGEINMHSPDPALFDQTFTADIIASCFLHADEIQERLTRSPARHILMGEYRSCAYAALMFRGLYPDQMGKPCQDSYVINEALFPGRDEYTAHWFMIFDGHGPDGHECAWYCRDNMEHVADQILEREPRISIPDLLVQTNETVDRNLHKNFHIPSDDSGSTAVSVLAIGSTLYCSNVGDSRCILGVRNPAKVVPKALSSDQTLYRADERQRVLDLGGRVLSIGQIEGRVPINHEFVCELGDEIDQNGDPPRIWLQKKFEPGCAFSRSLGDKIAETVGCVATPEIMAHELSDDDVVCIIASDGVWEFLTNQNVVDICLATLDPYTASYKIVSTAYQEWYEQEERIDDISVIVLFFGRHEMQQNNDQNVRLDTLPKRSRRGSHAKLAVEFEKTASILPVEERNTRRGSFSRLGFSKTRGSMDA